MIFKKKDGNLVELTEKEYVDQYSFRNCKAIKSLPADNYSGLVYVDSNISVDGISIPKYSRGIIMNISNSVDSAAIFIDNPKYIYICFRNGQKWSCRKI